MRKSKGVLFKATVLLLICALTATVATALRASDYANPNALSKAHSVLTNLIDEGILPEQAIDVIGSTVLEAPYSATGDDTRQITFKGIVDLITVRINGNGTKLGAFNTTEFVAENGSTTNLNLKYYPRNITLTLKGYEWWSSNHQHIVNNTGAVIATINETDGSWTLSDDYTSENPIWQSRDANVTVNTSAGWLESVDTVAETISIIYNISIDDGKFLSATLGNVSFYVAPNATAGTGQDDLNIYISTDGGSTWTIIVDGADGSTSSGTQYTGTVDLTSYVNGTTSFLIKIEFVSDGADDDTTQADVHFDKLLISGTVSKLPSRSPKVDVDGDGVWDYSTTEELLNGTSVSFSLGDTGLNLTNTIKVSVDGSEKVIVNFTWYDDGRVHIVGVSGAGDSVTVDRFVEAGNNTTIVLTNMTRLFAPITATIDVDTEHTLNSSYNYTVYVSRFPYMLISDGAVTVSPVDGVFVQTHKPSSHPIPVFVKPRNAQVEISVNVWNPNASVGEVYLNMTVTSASGNVVDVVIANVTGIDQLDLYIDGDYVETINVTDGVAYFNLTNFSTHTVTLMPAGALVAVPEEISWTWIAGVIMVAVMAIVLVYLFVATFVWRR